MTNYFERQQQARSSTVWLIVFLILAVIGIVGALDIAAYFLWIYFFSAESAAYSSSTIFKAVTFWALLAIGLGSLFRVLQLRKGGAAVAELMGARPIEFGSPDVSEKRLYNIVEEMAIASGIPMPPVYVMDREPCINAFAAGYQPTQAIVCVTKGALEKLSREELQAVVAHEFSHIFNGDMRLNIRLLGILHGIQIIGNSGLHILRSFRHRRSLTSRHHDRSDGTAGFVLVGLVLAVVGYIGVFFARLIKSAISRQREYLADASAVQYTRNPEGLGRALFKILQDTDHSHILNRHAEEMSHMFFGSALNFGNWFATHPPLDERIKAVSPRILQELVAEEHVRIGREIRTKSEPVPSAPVAEMNSSNMGLNESPGRSKNASSEFSPTLSSKSVPYSSEEFLASVGNPGNSQLLFAQKMMEEVSPLLLAGARESTNAPLLILSTLAAFSGTAKEYLSSLFKDWSEERRTHFLQIVNAVEKLNPAYRLPLLEMAIGSMRHLSEAELADFFSRLQAVIWADGRITLFEFTAATILKNALVTPPVRGSGVMPPRLNQLKTEVASLLSAFACAGQSPTTTAQQLFLIGQKSLGLLSLELKTWEQCGAETLDLSLNRFRRIQPSDKARLLEALAKMIIHDGQINLSESELLRAVSLAIDCPVPPMTIPA